MSYVCGEDREQLSLLPARLDDYVSAGSMTRVIDAFFDRLDVVKLRFVRAVPAAMGRPGYDPRDLLKLYVYGYLNEVRSSRKLERECGRNVELMWLMHRLAPDFKTIADFRRDNLGAIVAVSHEFIGFCRAQGLLGRVVAVDGSKFRAVASARRVMGRKEIQEESERIEAKVKRYLDELDKSDAREATEETVTADRERVRAALAALKQRQEELARLGEALEESGRTTLVEGERDARALKLGTTFMIPVYNVQTAVDAESGLIVHHAVSDEAGDNRQLLPMALGAQAALGGGPIRVLADAGYSNGAQVAACEQAAIEPCAPANRSTNVERPVFDRSAFVYHRDDDTYVCPAGERLRRIGFNRRDQLISYATNACRSCPLKPQCTNGKRRVVNRHLHEDALQRMNARIAADPELMRLRSRVVEHPFGTIKRMMAGGRFLTRSLKNVAAEIALSILAYNLKRLVGLRGATPFCPTMA